MVVVARARDATLPTGKLVELGVLTELATKRKVAQWDVSKAPVLAYDEQRRLFVVYPKRTVLRPASKVARKEYARTHWGAQGRGTARGGGVAVGPFVAIGPGTSITYTTRKGRDVELVDWVHAWGEGGPRKFTPPTVVMHDCRACGPRCGAAGALALQGGSYTVTERGIVG